MKNMQELKLELQNTIAKIVRKNRKKSITKSADEIGMDRKTLKRNRILQIYPVSVLYAVDKA